MRIQIINIFLCAAIICTLASCNQQTKKYRKAIIGEWAYTKQIYKGGMKSDPTYEGHIYRLSPKYNFINDSICEDETGYYFKERPIPETGKRQLFLGYKTKYRIQNDSLEILNPQNNTWDRQKIRGIDANNIELEVDDNTSRQFKKVNYSNEKEEIFDQVIFSSSACFGPCPIIDVSVKKQGEVIYYGEHFTTADGLYSSSISKEIFRRIQNNFREAKILDLKDYYKELHTDGSSMSLTFVKNGKIIKKIDDNGSGPDNLKSAYIPLMYLYQQLKLKPIDKRSLPVIFPY